MTEQTDLTDINQVLARVTEAVVGQFELNRLLQQVVTTSMETLHAEVCSIFLVDRNSSPTVLTMRAGSGFAGPLVGKAQYEIGEGFTGYIAKHGEKFNIRTPEELRRLAVGETAIWQGKYDHVQFDEGKITFRNLVALPLKIKDRILGVLKIENKDERYGSFFSDNDERYCETIANVVALAIENARLHQQTESQSKTMAAMAAHRINNQLTTLDGIEVDLLDEVTSPVPDKQKLEDLATRIRETRLGVAYLIDELKRYGKPIELTCLPVDLNELIRNEIWLARPPAPIQIHENLELDLPLVSIDARRLGESVKEIIRNAIKVLQAARKGNTIHISTKRESDVVAVLFEDDGPGFPQEFPIFKPFVTTDPHGTGLGLATVKEVVEAHGGTIKAGNSADTGAIIEIRLPLTVRRPT